jgi:hypothetical protein
MVWPFVARHMVRKSIASCIDQLEDYYTFVMGTFLYHDPKMTPNDTDITKGEKIESKIQSAIDACSVLLELTDHEPRFRGPFPKLFYKEMIVSLRNILDRLLSIRIALLQMPLVVKHDICEKEYHVERRDMVIFFLYIYFKKHLFIIVFILDRFHATKLSYTRFFTEIKNAFACIYAVCTCSTQETYGAS